MNRFKKFKINLKDKDLQTVLNSSALLGVWLLVLTIVVFVMKLPKVLFKLPGPPYCAVNLLKKKKKFRKSSHFRFSNKIASAASFNVLFFFFSGCSCKISAQKSPKTDKNWWFVMNWLPKHKKFCSEKSKNGRNLVTCHELIAKNGQNLRNSAQKSPKMDEIWWLVMNWLPRMVKNRGYFVYCPIQVTWLFSNLNLQKVRLTWVRLG